MEGRTRGAGSESVLACDMCFAARESAIFGYLEAAFGLVPGAGGMQHLTRLLGRNQALEALLGACDYDADVAERYGWINRALAAEELGDFVRSIAHRIVLFPAAARRGLKSVNAIALASTDEFRRDSELFGKLVLTADSQNRTESAMKRGFQTPDGELNLSVMLGQLK